MSVNKVQLANGETIIDISDSTVTPETLAEGVTAHDASGQKITGKMVPGGGASVQTDWNQTDETAPDFLKNKPFYSKPVVLVEEQTYTPDEENGADLIAIAIPEIGTYVTSEYDGVVYTSVVTEFNGMSMVGNLALFGGTDTGEPFLGVFFDGILNIMDVDNTTDHTLECVGEIVKTIPEKYSTPTVLQFYTSSFNDMSYLYLNIPGEKAKKEDVMKALNKTIVIDVGFGYAKLYPLSIITGGAFEYAILQCNINGETINFVTSEYVPESTT